MRSRLRRSVVLIFIDDSRGGISTTGFCFWNVVVVDQDRKLQVAMGAMTMSASNEAVYWILSSLASMTLEAKDVVQGMISDLGESTVHLQSLNILLLIYVLLSNRDQGRPCQ